MVHADRQDGPEQDHVSHNMEPTGDQDVSNTGEEIGRGPDWIHVGVMHHVRTTFNDCNHGSEMQRNAILQNLHEAAM
eukprot:10672301-Lingulodinium_polyedra.AAC.1